LWDIPRTFTPQFHRSSRESISISGALATIELEHKVAQGNKIVNVNSKFNTGQKLFLMG
jgi:hypothetical protein